MSESERKRFNLDRYTQGEESDTTESARLKLEPVVSNEDTQEIVIPQVYKDLFASEFTAWGVEHVGRPKTYVSYSPEVTLKTSDGTKLFKGEVIVASESTIGDNWLALECHNKALPLLAYKAARVGEIPPQQLPIEAFADLNPLSDLQHWAATKEDKPLSHASVMILCRSETDLVIFWSGNQKLFVVGETGEVLEELTESRSSGLTSDLSRQGEIHLAHEVLDQETSLLVLSEYFGEGMNSRQLKPEIEAVLQETSGSIRLSHREVIEELLRLGEAEMTKPRSRSVLKLSI